MSEDVLHPDVLPPYMKPLFMSTASQQIFSCVVDEQVTADKPHILVSKEKINEDFYNRAAVCDFHPVKKQVEAYPGEEILLVYDPDYRYGENFYVCLTEEGKEVYLEAVRALEKQADDEEKNQEEDEMKEVSIDDIVLKDLPSTPQPWQGMGSEKELEEEGLTESRPLISFKITRKRRFFGAAVSFDDRSCTDTKDSYTECASFEDATFDLHRKEHDCGVQSVVVTSDRSSQTDWKKPRNANTQYEARTLVPEEKIKINESESLANFVEAVCPRFKLALQQNEIMNVFADDYKELVEVDGVFGSKTDNNLKEYQSFTDLEFSKDKTISGIDWHPSIKGIVAVTYTEKLKYDDRVDLGSKLALDPSLILVWGFSDPIHPQLVLHAPDDIFCFKFNPTDPNIVAAGCINGQVVVWDISEYESRLKNHRQGGARTNKNHKDMFDVEYERSPVVHYAAVSSIEGSHKMCCTEIIWLPDTLELARLGIPVENKNQMCCQLVTVGIDGNVMFWDIRLQKNPAQGAGPMKSDKSKEEKNNYSSIPSTFHHLDLQWKPINVVPLTKLVGLGLHPGTSISISQIIHQKRFQNLLTGEPSLIHRQNSSHGRSKRTELEGVNTKFFAGTEDGYVMYTDWKPEKDPESGKMVSSKPMYSISSHGGPIHTIARSPFYNHILLSCGGWELIIWKEGEPEVLQCTRSPIKLTSACWSPTRPGVFFVGRGDGNVDIWDLMDRSHEPSLSQNISSAAISSIVPRKISNKQLLLAVGDRAGTLHILEVPWSLRQPTANEQNNMGAYFERETSRIAYFKDRETNRHSTGAGKAPEIPGTFETDQEEEERLKKSYNNYLQMEHDFLVKLGMRRDDEPLSIIT